MGLLKRPQSSNVLSRRLLARYVKTQREGALLQRVRCDRRPCQVLSPTQDLDQVVQAVMRP
jgi:hypothetical protein